MRTAPHRTADNGTNGLAPSPAANSLSASQRHAVAAT